MLDLRQVAPIEAEAAMTLRGRASWVIHVDADGAWVEMPDEDYNEMRRMALIRGVSMSDVLAEAWREYLDSDAMRAWRPQ